MLVFIPHPLKRAPPIPIPAGAGGNGVGDMGSDDLFLAQSGELFLRHAEELAVGVLQ